MNRSKRNRAIPLAEGAVVALRSARGDHLECTEGMVWLTIEGQPGDFFLSQGTRLQIKSNGLVLLEGMPYGVIRQDLEVNWSLPWIKQAIDPLKIMKHLFLFKHLAWGRLWLSRNAENAAE